MNPKSRKPPAARKLPQPPSQRRHIDGKSLETQVGLRPQLTAPWFTVAEPPPARSQAGAEPPTPQQLPPPPSHRPSVDVQEDEQGVSLSPQLSLRPQAPAPRRGRVKPQTPPPPQCRETVAEPPQPLSEAPPPPSSFSFMDVYLNEKQGSRRPKELTPWDARVKTEPLPVPPPPWQGGAKPSLPLPPSTQIGSQPPPPLLRRQSEVDPALAPQPPPPWQPPPASQPPQPPPPFRQPEVEPALQPPPPPWQPLPASQPLPPRKQGEVEPPPPWQPPPPSSQRLTGIEVSPLPAMGSAAGASARDTQSRGQTPMSGVGGRAAERPPSAGRRRSSLQSTVVPSSLEAAQIGGGDSYPPNRSVGLIGMPAAAAVAAPPAKQGRDEAAAAANAHAATSGSDTGTLKAQGAPSAPRSPAERRAGGDSQQASGGRGTLADRASASLGPTGSKHTKAGSIPPPRHKQKARAQPSAKVPTRNAHALPAASVDGAAGAGEEAAPRALYTALCDGGLFPRPVPLPGTRRAAASDSGGEADAEEADSEDDCRVISELDQLILSTSADSVRRRDSLPASATSGAQRSILHGAAQHGNYAEFAVPQSRASRGAAADMIWPQRAMHLDMPAAERLLVAHLPRGAPSNRRAGVSRTLSAPRSTQPAREGARRAPVGNGESTDWQSADDWAGGNQRGRQARASVSHQRVDEEPPWLRDFLPVLEPGAQDPELSEESRRSGLVPSPQSADFPKKWHDSVAVPRRAAGAAAAASSESEASATGSRSRAPSGILDFAALARRIHSPAGFSPAAGAHDRGDTSSAVGAADGRGSPVLDPVALAQQVWGGGAQALSTQQVTAHGNPSGTKAHIRKFSEPGAPTGAPLQSGKTAYSRRGRQTAATTAIVPAASAQYESRQPAELDVIPGGDDRFVSGSLSDGRAPAYGGPPRLPANFDGKPSGSFQAASRQPPPPPSRARSAYPTEVVQKERQAVMGTADELRQRAFGHREKRDQCQNASRKAAANGDLEMADVWREQAREEDEKYNEHRQRSNDTAFLGSNIGLQQTHMVDLHGMLVDEAIEKLEHQLICCGGLASGHPEGVLLRVVVGKGKHSVDGKPRLAPAVVRVLSDGGFRFAPDPTNPGIIEVTIGGLRAGGRQLP